jgi:glucose-1-phosphate cytidylyltransferase
MKVVLFCGGYGLRIRDYSANTPKPMVPIGYRPIMWQVMKYYAQYGHKDFILAMGYGADVIKDYFLHYNECLSNNFTLADGGKTVRLFASDTDDWRITFVDTGVASPIGERLRRVKDYLDGDEVFLANYTDSLTDCPLPNIIDHFYQTNKIATFLCVKPNLSFHVVSLNNIGYVDQIEPIKNSPIRINGGYFVLRREIFDYIRPGDELVNEPFERLIREQQLTGYSYNGFWVSMDTFKDKQQLDEMHARDEAPWEVWKTPRTEAPKVSSPVETSKIHVGVGF